MKRSEKEREGKAEGMEERGVYMQGKFICI